MYLIKCSSKLFFVFFQFRFEATNLLFLLNDTINDRNDLFVDVNATHSCSWNDRNEDENKKKNREKTKKYENLLATLANRSNADDLWIRCSLRVFWCDFECRNRKIRIFRRNRLQRYSRICYKISWCCRKSWWFLRKKRTCNCWLLLWLTYWFDCIDRKRWIDDWMFLNIDFLMFLSRDLQLLRSKQFNLLLSFLLDLSLSSTFSQFV